MVKRMLVDATHPEETRVAIVDSHRDSSRLEDFDFSLTRKPILRGNIYLAKVIRIEPSLQAAFVEYGGNRHGFLPFGEIHPDYFRIPMADRSVEEEDQGAAEDEDSAILEEEPPQLEDPDLKEEPPAPPEILAPPPVFPHALGDSEDMAVGLITDFGNAVLGDSESLTEVIMPQVPPESVGGDTTERIVRQHKPRYKIQEVVKRGQIMLIQVVKEERGNKGAALTTYLSLAGRYCVLMPNTDHGGGVSRKITNHQDRRRMKEILDQLEIPEGMAVILRTAGMEQDPPDIQRDLEYLLSIWDHIREQTLQATAPALIYEEANLLKRCVRDLYAQEINEILVAGQEGYEQTRDFMRALMPDQVEKIKLYEDSIPLFIRYQVEKQIDALSDPVVQLRSGGYLVINPTEALVSIDVNSGRATRERHIEETALKTNLEAAEEVARQLRLRDLAGLIVIDYIDMEEGRNNSAVERRMKEAMKNDRARLQIGRLSPFGLMELSRQRLRPSLVEINFEKCPHCAGLGYIRSSDAAALSVLRAIEEEAIRARANTITASVPAHVAIFMLNCKRDVLDRLEKHYGITILMEQDDHLPPPGYKIERAKGRPRTDSCQAAVNTDQVFAETQQEQTEKTLESGDVFVDDKNDRTRRRQNKNRRTGSRHTNKRAPAQADQAPAAEDVFIATPTQQPHEATAESEQEPARRRRRGRRGGRRHTGQETNGSSDIWSTPPAPVPDTEGSLHSYAAAQDMPVAIPTSIHDLDTTPKPVAKEHPKPPRPTPEGSEPKTYEIINPPADQPKGGWWRRLTSQD
ncbi:MAG: ribonuclease E/G [Alphaproteobacteria bacterium]|nr:ribonuclease E/G [Alphaproteobacteria bacterium]